MVGVDSEGGILRCYGLTLSSLRTHSFDLRPQSANDTHIQLFANLQGRIHERSDAAQQKRAKALNLVIATIKSWNTLYMDNATDYLEKTGQVPDSGLLPFTSPLGRGVISSRRAF